MAKSSDYFILTFPCVFITLQGSAIEDDGTSHSDSNIDDNVKVIIGNIKTDPSMYMYVTLNVLGLWDIWRSEERNTMGVTSPLTVLNIILGAHWKEMQEDNEVCTYNRCTQLAVAAFMEAIDFTSSVLCGPFLTDDFGLKLFRILLFVSMAVIFVGNQSMQRVQEPTSLFRLKQRPRADLPCSVLLVLVFFPKCQQRYTFDVQLFSLKRRNR